MKIKKLIAMVLTWSLLLCLYSPASATQASNAHSLEPSIQNQMLRILLSIEKEKEKYGFKLSLIFIYALALIGAANIATRLIQVKSFTI